MSASAGRGWARSVSLAPSLSVALLSKFTCSLCVAAYAGVLGSLGLGVLTTTRGLTVLTVTFLGLNLLSLGWSAWRHRHRGPLMLTLLGSAVVLAWRIWPTAPAILYGGTVLIVAASGWNLWAARQPIPSLMQLSQSRPFGLTQPDD